MKVGEREGGREERDGRGEREGGEREGGREGRDGWESGLGEERGEVKGGRKKERWSG